MDYRYCIPLDNSRPFTAVEKQFFSECNTGSGEYDGGVVNCLKNMILSVPVIAIFTKFDALVQNAYAALRKLKYKYREAMDEAPSHAKMQFNQIYPDLVYKTTYPPKGHVCLQSVYFTLKICSLSSFFLFLRDASSKGRLQ